MSPYHPPTFTNRLRAFYNIATSSACGTSWGTHALPCCLFPSCMAGVMGLPDGSSHINSTLVLVGDATTALSSARSRSDFLRARSRLRSEIQLTDRLMYQHPSNDQGRFPITTLVYEDARMVTSPLLSSLRKLLSNPLSWSTSAIAVWSNYNPRSAFRTSGALDAVGRWVDTLDMRGITLAPNGNLSTTPSTDASHGCPRETKLLCSGGISLSRQPIWRDAVGGSAAPLPSLSQLHEAVTSWNVAFSSTYATYSLAQLSMLHPSTTVGRAFAYATTNFGLQVQDYVNSIPESDQACLFADDRSITSLRAVIQAVEGFNPKETQFVEDSVMNVPGIGVYYGRDDILEYSWISSDQTFNNDYSKYVQSVQTLAPRTSKQHLDRLNLVQNSVSMWSNWTRVSEPVLTHGINFAPCSARTVEWNLTFSLESNIDYFTSGCVRLYRQ